MNNNGEKSATVAGLLGIFLGTIGAHDWYLGDKKKGTIHVILFGVGAVLMLIVGAILPSMMSVWTVYKMAGLFTLLNSAGWLAIAISEVWGVSEGIQILIKGDAGLAQRGHKVMPMSNGPVNGQRDEMGIANGTMSGVGGVSNISNANYTMDQTSSMNGEMGQQSESGQERGQAMGDGGVWGGNGNVSNAPARPAKQPMDPAKKKKLIKMGVIGGCGILVVIAAVVIVSMLMKVEYQESYLVAKELRVKVSDLNNNYDCERVINNAKSSMTSESTFAGYVDGCKSVADGVDELVEKLGQTSGVKRNKEIKAQFEKFEETMKTVLPDEDELEQRLSIYEAWHRFVVLSYNLTAGKSSDAEFQNAAKALTESDNQILVTYGQGWLEKTLAYVQAYRAYYNASIFAENKEELGTIMRDAQTEQKNWIGENKPDIAEVGGLKFENTSKMSSEFTKLYSMITEAYEENYDDSGECLELFGEVICD